MYDTELQAQKVVDEELNSSSDDFFSYYGNTEEFSLFGETVEYTPAFIASSCSKRTDVTDDIDIYGQTHCGNFDFFEETHLPGDRFETQPQLLQDYSQNIRGVSSLDATVEVPVPEAIPREKITDKVNGLWSLAHHHWKQATTIFNHFWKKNNTLHPDYIERYSLQPKIFLPEPRSITQHYRALLNGLHSYIDKYGLEANLEVAITETFYLSVLKKFASDETIMMCESYKLNVSKSDILIGKNNVVFRADEYMRNFLQEEIERFLKKEAQNKP